MKYDVQQHKKNPKTSTSIIYSSTINDNEQKI